MNQKTGMAEYHKELYPKAIIDKAISDFSGIVSVRVIGNDRYWVCSFENSRFEIGQTMMEFENYMIDLQNVRE